MKEFNDPLLRWLSQPSRWVPIVLFAVVVVGFAWLFPNVLSYLVVGGIFALIGSPVYNGLERVSIKGWTPGRDLRALLSVLTLMLGMAAVGLGLVPLVWHQASMLAEIQTEEIIKNLEKPIEDAAKQLQSSPLGRSLADSLFATSPHPLDSNEVEENPKLEERMVLLINKFLDFANIGNILSSVLGVFSNVMLTLVSALFISFFLIRDRKRILPYLLGLVPGNLRPTIRETLSESRRLLTRYFWGILLQLFLVMSLEMLGLTLVGVHPGLALTIAVFAGLFNIIPYVGPILGGLVGLGLGLSANLHLEFSNELLPLLLRMGLVFFIVQQLDGFLLQPLIFSRRVNAHPLEIFLIVFIGGNLAGIAGMIAAVPVYTVARVFVRESWKALYTEYRLEETKEKS